MRITLTLTFAAALAATTSAQRAVPSHQTGPAEVVRVNGTPLLSDRLDAAMRAVLPQESFHRNVSASRMTELRAQALDTIVNEELEYQAGVGLGIRPSAADVDAAVNTVRKTFPSPQAFDAALRKAGATMAGARRELARSLTIDRAVSRQVTSRCSVTPADARHYFDQNHDRFVIPEQLHVYAITIGVDPSAGSKEWADAKATAQDVLKQIRAGAAFDALARKYSTDSSRTSAGDMGFIHRGSLSDQFEAATKHLPVGQASDVVQTIYGFHIIRVAEIRPARAKTFDEVERTLAADLTATRCADMKAGWIADLRRTAKIVVAAQSQPRP